jgi:integrase
MQSGCRPLQEDEIKAMLAALPTVRDRALFVLGLKSGFRISELLSLKVSDVYQYGKVLDAVAVARGYMKGKTAGRSIPLHDEAKAALLELISSTGLQPYHYLFRTRKASNRPITRGQAWRVLKAAARAAQVPGKVATHSMRKTFAEKVYKRLGKDLLKTQRALGHKSINSTVSYLSFAESEIEDAILGD